MILLFNCIAVRKNRINSIESTGKTVNHNNSMEENDSLENSTTPNPSDPKSSKKRLTDVSVEYKRDMYIAF